MSDAEEKPQGEQQPDEAKDDLADALEQLAEGEDVGESEAAATARPSKRFRPLRGPAKIDLWARRIM